IPVSAGAVQLPEEVSLGAVHISEHPCPSEQYISRVNHSPAPISVPPSLPTLVAEAESGWLTTWIRVLPADLASLVVAAENFGEKGGGAEGQGDGEVGGRLDPTL